MSGKRIDIIYFDAGSGHRSAAYSLQRALSNLRPNWRINPVNFMDLVAHRGDSPADMAVSVTPMFNPVIFRSLRLANPDARCVTIPVDYAEVTPGYWFTPQTEQHYLIGTKWLEDQAREAKIPEKFMHSIGGIIIDPGFYAPAPARPSEEIARLGLNPQFPTGIVSFGGQGNNMANEVMRQLSMSNPGVNMIFLCGRNKAAYEKLSVMETSYKKLVLGYLDETPVRYFQLADFVIGKAGAMTINECLVMRKPLIIIKSHLQSGHEAWVKSSGTGIVLESTAELASAIRLVLGTDRYRQNADREYHRGIFDAAEVLCALAETERAAKTMAA